MKIVTVLTASFVLLTASVGGVLADANHGHGSNVSKALPSSAFKDGGHGMMQMMMRMHANMMDDFGMGQMDIVDQNMMRMMTGNSSISGPMVGFDADGDGKVTPEEAHGQLQSMHTSFDANGDGNLSIDEFERLHSAMIRDTMVDRFQHLDADGDGKVTAGEMTAPADKMERMNMWPGAMNNSADN